MEEIENIGPNNNGLGGNANNGLGGNANNGLGGMLIMD